MTLSEIFYVYTVRSTFFELVVIILKVPHQFDLFVSFQINFAKIQTFLLK